MGFRSGAYAKVWEVYKDRSSDKVTRTRISISRKNRGTGEYVQDFSGFVSFIGADVAKRALELSPGMTIKLGDCDVSNKYDREKGATYTNYNVFNFEEINSRSHEKKDESGNNPTEGIVKGVDEIDEDDFVSSDLPF